MPLKTLNHLQRTITEFESCEICVILLYFEVIALMLLSISCLFIVVT